jgi:hypothetical protein
MTATYGSDNGVLIRGNSFDTPQGFKPILEADFSTAFGSFTFKDNLFSANPEGAYAVPSASIKPEGFARP